MGGPRGRLLYEGKAKKVYDLGGGEALLVFKDEVTARNGALRSPAPGKAAYAARLAAKLFEVLEDAGIETHYVCYEEPGAVRVKLHQVLPLEIVVRLYAYGGMLQRLPLVERLKRLEPCLVELHYKSDKLGDPLLHPMDPVYAGLLSREELAAVEQLARRAARVLEGFWAEKGLKLVDLKLEVARGQRGFTLVDEVTGDTMRLLDPNGRHLDKQVYRDTGSVEALLEAYRVLAEKAGAPRRRCRA